MTDTKKQYTENVELKKSICDSISRQFMVSHDAEIPLPAITKHETNYITTGKRSFEQLKVIPVRKWQFLILRITTR